MSEEPQMPEAELGLVISCPDCGTRTTVPVTEFTDAVDEHNELRHGGDDIAGIDQDFLDGVMDEVRDEILDADREEDAADV